ncbi:MAG: hypothetical protein R6V60_14775 [Desulfobacterales bacterium]
MIMVAEPVKSAARHNMAVPFLTIRKYFLDRSEKTLYTFSPSTGVIGTLQ